MPSSAVAFHNVVTEPVTTEGKYSLSVACRALEFVAQYVEAAFEHVVFQRLRVCQQHFSREQPRRVRGDQPRCLAHRRPLSLADICPREPRPPQELVIEPLVSVRQDGTYLLLRRVL